ncbi:MAG: hypothetical protein Q7K45_03925, partial [Nanoarchaeota archaeon]|nr:hypothetical protein [Nanoarchaeota archaeon]
RGTLMLFAANDFSDDYLWRYNAGKFQELPLPLKKTGKTYSMGATAFENPDGSTSLHVTDLHRIIKYQITEMGIIGHNEWDFKRHPDFSPGAVTAWPITNTPNGNLIVGFGGIYPGSTYSGLEQNCPPNYSGIMILKTNGKIECYSTPDVHQMILIPSAEGIRIFTQQFPTMAQFGVHMEYIQEK